MKHPFYVSLITAAIMTIASTGDASAVNPLLEPSKAPYGSIPFNHISPQNYEDAIREAIRIHDREIREIAENKNEPTFENTIVALDRAGGSLRLASLALGNLDAALGDTILMNTMARVTPALTEHSANIMLNEDLFKRVKKVHDNSSARTDLTPEDRRLISETYKEFVESGANLTGKDRETYKRLLSELSDLTLRFGQNVSNELKNPKNRLWLTKEQLGGLPESIVAAARAEANETLEAEGKTDDGSMYLFTLFAPSYSPFMKYSSDRKLREELWRMYNSRNYGGDFDNTQILKDIANIRLELARLLGYSTFAESNLQRTMVGTPANVMDFLENLRKAYTPAMRDEIKEIEEFASKTEGADFKLMAWDYSYWSDKLKNARYAFNDEDMRPYLELNNTIKGVFGLAEKLYGYKFKVNKNIPVYHLDVTAYEVYDANGKIMGIFLTDFYYRAGKSPGAWETEFRGEWKDDKGEKTIPIISIVCNFSKPVGKDPVLLTPYEAGTFLHEFGHALHALSADTKYASLSGTNVYHDFVELFSQFNENYLTQKKFLDGFARHYKTGKPMPQSLIDKFIKSSQFGAAYACMRQLGFGYLDMAYHNLTQPLRASADIEQFEKEAVEPVKVFDQTEGCVISPAFGHIFSGGYAAGYYGYKWAEMLDADAFSLFKQNGIFDKKTAAKFHKMLCSGGTVDPMDLYIEFRGQKPTVDALLERDGIKK